MRPQFGGRLSVSGTHCADSVVDRAMSIAHCRGTQVPATRASS